MASRGSPRAERARASSPLSRLVAAHRQARELASNALALSREEARWIDEFVENVPVPDKPKSEASRRALGLFPSPWAL
jgi:hypothetical protein